MVRSARPSPFRISGFVEDRRWNGTSRFNSQSEGGERRRRRNRRRKMRLTRAEGRLIISKDASATMDVSGGISPVGLRYVSIGRRPRRASVTSRDRQTCMKETANSSSSGSSSPLIRSRNYRPRDERIARRLRTIVASKKQWSGVLHAWLHAPPRWNAS